MWFWVRHFLSYLHVNNAEKRRQKRHCPVCNKMVFNVPRHLQDQHTYTQQAARMYRIDFGLAKSTAAVLSCPVSQCSFRTPRLDKHLRRQHKLPTDQCRMYRKLAVMLAQVCSLTYDCPKGTLFVGSGSFYALRQCPCRCLFSMPCSIAVYKGIPAH